MKLIYINAVIRANMPDKIRHIFLLYLRDEISIFFPILTPIQKNINSAAEMKIQHLLYILFTDDVKIIKNV